MSFEENLTVVLISYLPALMLLVLTKRRMVRSAHLALSLIRFTAKLILPFQINVRTRK